MTEDNITFWFYCGDEPIYCIRGPKTLSDQGAKAKALEQHDRIPLCYPEPPYVFHRRLFHSRVERGNA